MQTGLQRQSGSAQQGKAKLQKRDILCIPKSRDGQVR